MNTAVVILVVLVALIAAIFDFKTYKIPNWLTFGFILIGIIFNTILSGWPGLIFSFQGFLIGGLLLLPFFLLGGMGAGDVKLLAGIGAIGGGIFAINTLFVGSLLGGLAAIIILARIHGVKSTIYRFSFDLGNLVKKESQKDNIVLPYGVFLSAGALTTCFWGVF